MIDWGSQGMEFRSQGFKLHGDIILKFLYRMPNYMIPNHDPCKVCVLNLKP